MESICRILVTGSRNYDNVYLLRKWLTRVIEVLGPHGDNPPTLVHGDCPTGADKLADDLWKELGWPVERHPADWDTHGKFAGPKRNREMAELGADICVAFPLGESKGTRGMMKLAKDYGISLFEVPQE